MLQQLTNSWCIEVEHTEFIRLISDYEHLLKENIEYDTIVFRLCVAFFFVIFIICLCYGLNIGNSETAIIIGICLCLCIICLLYANNFDDDKTSYEVKVHKVYFFPNEQPCNYDFFMYQGRFFVSNYTIDFINRNS